MYYTDNPIADYDRYSDDQERELERCPKCEKCGQPITDSYCYEIEGELICEECLDIYYRKDTEDFIE